MASTVKAGVPAPGGGTTVSFSNAPQAGDDYFDSSATGITEDTTSIIKLNVMGNDLGGAAKSLWSLDDGTANSGTGTNPNGTTYNKDLLTQDQIGATNQSALGAEISITDDGQVAYKLTSTLKNALQYLGAGETTTDSFTYAIRLGNGTLSWAKSTVEIAGTNDEAKITGDVHGGVKEDASALPAGTEGTTETDATQTLAFTDADWHDTHSASVEDGTNLGTLQATVVFDTYTGDGTHYGTGNASTGEIDLDYSVDDSAIDYLGEGQTKVETFTVDLTETHPDHTTSIVKQTVSFTITGTNDDAVFTSSGTGHTAGSVIEDASGTATETTDGTLSFDDVDVIDTHTVTVTPVGTHYGTLTVDHPITDTTDGTGGLLTWHYTVDNSAIQLLGANDQPIDTFTIDLYDGHTHVYKDVSITINGTDESAPPPSDIAPVAATDNWVVTNATQFTIPVSWLLGNDSDVDSSTLFITAVSGLPSGWDAVFDSDNHLTSIKSHSSGGSDFAFTYTLSDGTVTSTGTVNVDVVQPTGTSQDDTVNLANHSAYDHSYIDMGNGSDTVTEGDAVNFVVGGKGADVLIAGNGVDTFIYTDVAESAVTYVKNGAHTGDVTSDSRDQIQGFTSGADKIDLSALSVTSVDSNAGDGVATHSVTWATAGGDTIVYVNVGNSDETITAGATYGADMEIKLTGVTSLTNADFVLHS